jgi:hypothetical protein
VRWDVLCHDSTCCNYGALADRNAIGDDRACPDPDVIFYDNALSSDTLLDHWPSRISVNVVDRQYLHQWGSVHPVAHGDAALTTQHVQLADQTVSSNTDEGVGELPEIVNVQDSAVHHKAVLTDGDTAGAGMKIDTLIQIDIAPQLYVISKAQAHPILYGYYPVQIQNQPIQHSS